MNTRARSAEETARKRGLGSLGRVALLAVLSFGLLLVGGGHDPVSGQVGSTTKYVGVSPFRLVDTRSDPDVRWIAETTFRVDVRARGEVRDDVEAVAVSLVSTGASEAGHVVLYPTGGVRPATSNINYSPGHTLSTSAIVALGEGGSFDVFTSSRSDVVIDVTGVFVAANSASDGRFIGAPPQRVLDTRDGGGLAMGRDATVRVDLPADVPADASAAVVTLTSTAPNAPGYFTAYGAGDRPGTSTLNVSTQNSTRATTAIVPISQRFMQVYSSGGGHLLVDFIGYFTGPSAATSDVGLYVPTSPQRRLDTRALGLIRAGETRSFSPGDGGTVVGSVTIVDPRAPGYATAFANGSLNPDTSSINADDVNVVANMVVSRSSSAGIAIYSSVDAHYIFDQFGHFTSDLADIDGPTAPAVPAPNDPGPAPGSQPLPGAGCSVSALLVPSCGAWLGAATTDAAMKYDYATGLVEYEAVARNEPDIVHFYRSGGKPFPTASYRAVAERPGHQRSLMLINWKPSVSHSWQQVANGAADANIESAAVGMLAYPHTFFLTIWHEPENNMGAGNTPESYAAMYRHVVTKLRSLGVTNVVFVWNMMGYSGHSHMYDALYPGDDVVDWIAWNPYGKKKTADMGMLVDENCCKVPDWPGFYTWATRKAPGKPLMLGEWGFDLRETPQAPAALDAGAELLRTNYPALKALVYWNEDHPHAHVRLDQDTDLGRAYGAAYSRFANDPYFNSTSTAAAP